ncbi:Putative mannose-6-phosphate receptor binding domain superfamily, MRH domain-containing protein [Septoria linicola]|uniref:Mannose-6-phosphate receptor binding domain superfamily, MRH domain-containing protein n=1 Tax=Septoria linicola TaxID=215465 RepID=A0A9Q9EGY2_9PEZI|nr:putative mannose-6-phosphate receptor binding domain superfamily, MRH domain-containing protein [Septoria linicola]USW49322.1 Putative mannose-6-phosphate receptor binding domain superfamily, MRH domain-containing protein [Septoria linicola]
MPFISRFSPWLLLPAAISAVTFDCENIVADEQKFNFKALGGPKDVHKLVPDQFTVVNTTFTIDLCDTLKKPKGEESKHSCPNGSRICAVERLYNDEVNGSLLTVFPIAGQFTTSSGGHLEPKLTRLKGSSSNEDSKKEGLRVELHGGEHTNDGKKIKQKAIIEFLCDAEKEGTEGFDKEETAASIAEYGRMSKREDENEGDGEDKPELPDLDKGKALQLVSYKEEKDMGVLRLEWKTKYACEGAEKPPAQGAKKGSWGFFTWFLIIAFLLIATYIIFGSWLNYNRYGARGWDLIPHGDTIRDIPYIVKDWTSGVAGKMGSNGDRGGYSAV